MQIFQKALSHEIQLKSRISNLDPINKNFVARSLESIPSCDSTCCLFSSIFRNQNVSIMPAGECNCLWREEHGHGRILSPDLLLPYQFLLSLAAFTAPRMIIYIF